MDARGMGGDGGAGGGAGGGDEKADMKTWAVRKKVKIKTYSYALNSKHYDPRAPETHSSINQIRLKEDWESMNLLLNFR